MKESRNYSPKIMRLYNSLKRRSAKHVMPEYGDPLEAVVYGLICEQVPEQSAGRVYRHLLKHFVDLNDLRVSRREEILDVFKDTSKELEQVVRSVTQVLNAVFEKQDRTSLNWLTQEGKRQAHKELSEISGITPFAVSYCFLTALDGHAIPLNVKMLDYLRQNELVFPTATDAEIAGFLERLIGAADAYHFYMLVREEAEHGRAVPKAGKAASTRTAAKKKSTTKKKKKTAKKTTKKKKTTVKKKTKTKKRIPKK